MTSHRPRSIRGLVLAAGLGTRLKPLTDFYPKPLVPVAGCQPLQLALRRLAAAGIQDCAVNSHHLPNLIEQALRNAPATMATTRFHEAEILGTGGVFAPLQSWRQGADIVVYNGDVLSDVNLSEVIVAHRQSQAVATMVLLRDHKIDTNPVFASMGTVVAIGTKPKDSHSHVSPHTFTGIHILSEEFLTSLSGSGFSDVKDGYYWAFQTGRKVGAYFHSGFWCDMGNPQDYFDLHQRILAEGKDAGLSFLGRIEALSCLRAAGTSVRWVQATAEKIGEGTVKGPSLLIGEVSIGSGAELGPFVTAMQGSQFGLHSRTANAVILPATEVKAHVRVGQMIVAPQASIEVMPR